MSTLGRAIEIANDAHEGQKRWNGEPYITHPQRVSDSLKGDPARIVGWLHDVVEDSDTTLDDLWAEGFENEVVDAVEAVTKKKDETYLDFILRAKKNKIGTMVKIADIKDNLRDLEVSKTMRARASAAREKYLLALWILEN